MVRGWEIPYKQRSSLFGTRLVIVVRKRMEVCWSTPHRDEARRGEERRVSWWFFGHVQLQCTRAVATFSAFPPYVKHDMPHQASERASPSTAAPYLFFRLHGQADRPDDTALRDRAGFERPPKLNQHGYGVFLWWSGGFGVC